VSSRAAGVLLAHLFCGDHSQTSIRAVVLLVKNFVAAADEANVSSFFRLMDPMLRMRDTYQPCMKIFVCGHLFQADNGEAANDASHMVDGLSQHLERLYNLHTHDSFVLATMKAFFGVLERECRLMPQLFQHIVDSLMWFELALFIFSRDAAINSLRLQLYRKNAQLERKKKMRFRQNEASDIENAIALSLADTTNTNSNLNTNTNAESEMLPTADGSMVVEREEDIFQEVLESYILTVRGCSPYRLYKRWMRFMQQNNVGDQYMAPTVVDERNAPLRNEIYTKLLHIACMSRVVASRANHGGSVDNDDDDQLQLDEDDGTVGEITDISGVD
jgi:hypothetical protein